MCLGRLQSYRAGSFITEKRANGQLFLAQTAISYLNELMSPPQNIWSIYTTVVPQSIVYLLCGFNNDKFLEEWKEGKNTGLLCPVHTTKLVLCCVYDDNNKNYKENYVQISNLEEDFQRVVWLIYLFTCTGHVIMLGPILLNAALTWLKKIFSNNFYILIFLRENLIRISN
jgi:hypothetical protein